MLDLVMGTSDLYVLKCLVSSLETAAAILLLLYREEARRIDISAR